MRPLRWLLAALLLAMPAHARTPEHYRFDGLDLAVWRPAAQKGLAPVLVFSHGFHGSNVQSTWLMSALADHGYWVVAPNHRDARRLGRAEVSFARPQDWSEATYQDRLEDLRRTVTILQKKDPFVGKVDLSRLGLVGHSLGGYTVLGAAGAWPGWTLPVRPRAVLGWSPVCSPYVQHRTLSGLRAPVMFQGGTLDLGVTPSVKRRGGAYEQASAPKYYMELDGAGHFAWTDLNAQYRELILRYSLDFLDTYLMQARPTWEKAPGVRRLWQEVPSRESAAPRAR